MSTQDSRASVADGRGTPRKKEYNAMGLLRFGRPHRAFRIFGSWLAAAVMVGSQLAVPVAQAAPVAPAAAQVAAPPAAAQTSTIKLAVTAARTEPRALGGVGVTKGDAITRYKWIINEDNTGTTVQRNANPGSGCSSQDAGYPDSCTWTSIAGLASSAPVAAQGDETTLDGTIGISSLTPGRYLISVLADGFKLDGSPFTVPMDAPGIVEVPLQPTPLPTATIKAQVFADVTGANGQYDPGEDGLPGFAGFITDYIGQVTTDVFGNPLCTAYDYTDANHNGYMDPGEINLGPAPDYAPTVTHTGGKCLSGDINMDGVVNTTDVSLYSDPALDPGVLTIPNLGPNRYALSVVPPTGSSWVQTTTLEGNHDWDSWVMEGSTGLDTEFVVAGEPFPAQIFGFVPGPTSTYQAPAGQTYWQQPAHKFATGGTGTIKGVVDATKVYVPAQGGACLPGTVWGGLCGAKVDHPIDKPWITLTDLNRGDTAVWVGRGGTDGSFTIPDVPDGSYTITYWDEPQNYILDLLNVTVANGETVDMGILPLTGWFTKFDGYVFNDTNRNGIKDPGEKGVPDFTLTLRKRENSLMDRGATLVTTNADGYYLMENAYPLTEWLVLEAYNDRYYTTGVTYQADNQPKPTTILGQGVDVSVLPIIGLSGQIDWGVHAYDPTGATNGLDPQNGGIVGSVSYDTTRNEVNPQYAVAEDWQPGVSGLTVDLFAPVPCPTDSSQPCDANGDYVLAPDGSYAHGKLLNTYVTETWQKPTSGPTGQDCIARGVDGNPLQNPADQQVLPVGPDKGCLEGPLAGVQVGTYETDQGTPDANFGAAVDGNYGFGDACFDGTLDATDPANPVCVGGTFTPLPADDYLVHVNNISDQQGQPVYHFTREEDINIATGDSYVPQIPPPSCVGALHTVDVAGFGTDNYPPSNPQPGITVPASTPTDNPTFADIGGSPVEGQPKALCDTKLVSLQNGKSIVPGFNVFTDVPLPARFFAYNVDDLNFSTDPKSLLYGEKAGLPFTPVGIYDFTNRLVTTVETDYNGLFDVLLPSTDRISCPTPSGVCGNVYRFVGNDPGIPGRLNLNYNPQFRTIAADFEAWPGIIVPADTAPTQVGVTIQLPGTTTLAPIACSVNDPAATAATRIPELYAVDRPYATGTAAPITIRGQGFGTTPGQLTLTTSSGSTTVLPTASWTDTQITTPASYTVPAGLVGVNQLKVTAANGRSTVNGLTFYRIGGSYNPSLFEVGPTDNANYTAAKFTAGRWFTPAETLPATADHAIQRALDAAATYVAGGNNRDALVVVYPNKPSVDPRQNPRGAYYENLIITSKVKLQGVGPGSPDGSVRGSIIDGSAFAGDSPVATDWYTRIGGLTWAGNQSIYDGAVISLFLPSTGRNAFPASYSATTAPSIDGFDIRGGDQQGFPGNLNAVGGGPTGAPVGLVTQGGAIFANAYARNLQITNNVVQNNGGTFGTIRIGTPDLPAPDTSNHNEGVRIANNRVIANAGTNLAGGIGLFAGSDGYAVSGNDICGNFSAEYGGGMSVYGLSPNGSIDHNRVYYNQSYDEAGGIMIAGQLPADPSILSPGTGAVSIHDNLVQANLGNDDGGGIRFLMAGNSRMNVYNNMIVNNVSTHEGGGVAIDDAPNVRFYNNTVMKNVTTATAVTSDGSPAPAGLSTGQNSSLLQATLPAGSPAFSNPLQFNNIFWDNRAGTRSGATVTGIGATGDATPINNWDMGVPGTPNLLSPTNSVLQTSAGINASPTNIFSDPKVSSAYDTVLSFAPWRTNPNFIGAILVAADLPPKVLGDYHLLDDTSPAYNAGASSKNVPSYQQPAATQPAPATDIDGQGRPAFGAYDIGADEVPAPTADLSITKTDGATTVTAGGPVSYTITVANAGPSVATGAVVTDTLPATITGAAWTCTGVGGANCAAASGTGNLNTTANLPSGGSVTYTVSGTVSATATGTLANTAIVAAPAGTLDPNTANNTATDTDTIPVPVPDAIFANGFETGTRPWGWTSASTNTTSRLNVTAGAALAGSLGLQAQGNNTNYVQYDFGTAANPATGTFDARFSFNPNGNTGTNQDIFVARTTGGATVFRVRYRWNAGVPQVQVQVGTGTGNTAWTGITNGASNRIEVVWQSGATLQLFVGASTAADQSLTATATSVGGFRLGSVTAGSSATLEYFDAMSAKRSTAPVFGP